MIHVSKVLGPGLSKLPFAFCFLPPGPAQTWSGPTGKEANIFWAQVDKASMIYL